MEYQKINTLFKRDANNIIIPSQYTVPEFEYLKYNKFECTEKIDGTNIRIELTSSDNGINMAFKGRTDKTQIPQHLLLKLEQLFNKENLMDIFDLTDTTSNCNITIYGEGYGGKIQNGSNYIKNNVDFILFDIKIGNWWLDRKSCEQIAKSLNIKIVPLIGYMTIPEAIEYVKKGFKSTIAENENYEAEGLVLKTPYGLKFRNGERIILKIKTIDFIKFKNKYGDEENPDQPINLYY